MRRIIVLGAATTLLLTGCSLLPFQQKDVPPKPINGELCDAIDAKTIDLFVKNAKLEQGRNRTGVEQQAGFNDAYCDASSVESGNLSVTFRRFGQTTDQKPAERARDEIDKACADMRSGRWLDEQKATAPDATADPMTTPSSVGDKVCQITDSYTALGDTRWVGLEMVFQHKADFVRIRTFRPLADDEAQRAANAKWLMGINAQLLAVDLLTAEL